MQNTALMVAGSVFLLVAIMHLARVVLRIEVKVKGNVVPQGISVVGFVFALFLAAWMFMSAR